MRVEFDHLVVEQSDGVARVTLDRPERHNAMHYPAVRNLDAVSQPLADDIDRPPCGGEAMITIVTACLS